MPDLILRTCKKDLTARAGFQWPSSGSISAPDWDPAPTCGQGLHGLLWGKGNLGLLNWHPEAKWLVVSVETFVDLKDKVKFPKGDVLFVGSCKEALKFLQENGGEDLLATDPRWAYNYAFYVDEKPSKQTRDVACKDPEWAYGYALNVDEKPSKRTRDVACKDPQWAYKYAYSVDRKPSKRTRAAACKGPQWAYNYALYVDGKPSKQTRDGACTDPEWAYYYAFNMDKRPSKRTRDAARKDPEWAYMYALYVEGLE